ncbi:forkhead box protein P1-B isoform X2 [Tachysurus vachellii]|uniref:forkhead box protein P1-B isoform X2 n=1 Tax=Tachysurus vachellii TaxID=175792 RepID=UPI00296B2886|nr:forkhead box protein P1-B isoform X2 [Tachysurus vachellii]
MAQLNDQSGRSRGVKDVDVTPTQKEEQKYKIYVPNECDASHHSEEIPFTQSADKTTQTHFLRLDHQSPQPTQNRPSVLCSTSLLPLECNSISQISPKKYESAVKSGKKEYESDQTDHHKNPSTHMNSFIQSNVINSLFVNGRCHWPNCDEAFREYSVFMKHLNNRHSWGEKTIAQWRVQEERVRQMESQLVKERQKLQAMQLHLRRTEHPCAGVCCVPLCQRAALGWWRPLALPAPPSEEPDGSVEWAIDATGRHEYWPTATSHLLTDFVNSMECYKYINIRPPYTYAFLIRCSILEASDKQRALNEIYSWFIQRFFYFRHNTPTWKNAVRHNLSLHKCFVRVDGGKGAVWTVDETEFQKRKGQRFNRDSLKWMTHFSHPPKVS